MPTMRGPASGSAPDFGAPIAAGQADVQMLHDGHNRTLHPTSLTARLLRPFIDWTFPPYAPTSR